MLGSTRKRRFSQLGALVVAGSLAVAACGSDGGNEAGEAGDGSDVAVVTEAETNSAGTSAEAPQTGSGGVLRFGPARPVGNLDPDISTTNQDREWLLPAYDRLVHLTTEGDFIPGLAEDWSFSDDGLTLTLNLRDGVLFHDGSSLSADVVIANLDRSANLEGSVNASALSPVESKVAVDDLTVQLNLVKPAASLIGVLSGKTGMMISGQALADEVDLSSEMVGAGMFELVSLQPGDRAVYVRFDDYWDPDSALLEGLELVEVVDESARLNALRDAAGFDILRGSTLENWAVTFRLAPDLPWTDPKVREALAYALDSQSILDVVHQGAGTLTSQVFPPTYFAYSPNIPADAWPYDLEKAKALLAEAGYPDGFDISVGAPASDILFSEAIQASWAQIGVDLEFRPQEPSVFISNWFDGNFDMFAGPWRGRADPNVTNETLYSKDSTYINYNGYEAPLVDDLLDQSEAAVGEERTRLLHELAEAVHAVTFSIPLYSTDYIMASAENVKGVEIYTTFGGEWFRGVSISV